MPFVSYQITPVDPAAHYFDVSITIDHPDRRGQVVSLPAWIPGSYLIRDFSRHIHQLTARTGRTELAIKKIDNHTWQIAPCSRRLTLSYRVYAWDLSVRCAHLDQTHGFFNGTSVFLKVHGRETQPCLVSIEPGATTRNWRVYTSLKRARRGGQTTAPHRFGLYEAPNYDALVDHPVEMGTPHVETFTVCGAKHEMVFTGVLPNVDFKRIARDTAKICETQIRFFEPQTHRAPFLDSADQYVFMTYVTGKDYGGLEHRASTALVASRQDLPVVGNDERSEGYTGFLGLVSHEYFHTWNVKRIKPQAFVPYDLSRPNLTSLLWIFEGFTSYYDDLMLLRAGVVDEPEYLRLLAKTITSVHRGPGRHRQTVADSSFDAWNRYYRQDESSVNNIVSYYTKGSLVALALDLSIRNATGNRKSLDNVMRLMWDRYGRRFYTARQRGVQEDEFATLLRQATGVDLQTFIEKATESTDDLPLAALLAKQGVALSWQAERRAPGIGAVMRATASGEPGLAQVLEGGAAHAAGLSAGDILLAMDGLRIEVGNWEKLLSRCQAGQQVTLHYFRRDELRSTTLTLQAPANDQCSLNRSSAG
ncbi:peptidase M61 [Advenella kashmirensis W13003]|uniref:Peptidase M61 n=1 Tax=Advenella kashmirensis W13003 TaxID=1424334 RepID=V8QWC9_9BURK|nr:PDZ domain-containing protein [Advenella kashmirensis]ETF03319.1 peptidase M61 [Advenella kashmirensis W13003]